MTKSLIRVLVVDDYEPWHNFLSRALNQQELQIIGHVSDGMEAVHKAQQLRPDLILLDIGLPTLNGIEAACQIRNVSPASKVLFVSENRSPDIVEATLSNGALGYLVKSDAASELLPAIRAVVEGNRFISTSLAGGGLNAPLNPQAGARFHRDNVVTLTQTEKVGISRRHQAAFYADDAAFVDGFAQFMEGALKHGSPVIVIATALHRASLFQRLKADGVDVDAVIAQGRCISLDVADTLSTFMVNDLPDPVLFFRVAGDLIADAATVAKGERRQVAACGECAPVLLAQGNAEAAIRLDHLWDEIARSHEVEIFCGYVSGALEDAEESDSFLRICAEHLA